MTSFKINNTIIFDANAQMSATSFEVDNNVGSIGVFAFGESFQGLVAGYASGGDGTSPVLNTIDKFPFASDGNATDVGDLTVARNRAAGQSSSVSGYTSGGYAPALSPSSLNTIDKFPFASDGNATDVGDLTVARRQTAGQSSSVSGYTSGGFLFGGTPGWFNTIDKFPFATNANATDVGDSTVTRNVVSGQSSRVSGYTSGGQYSSGYNIIDKFSFASDGNATDVGDLTQARSSSSGQSSAVSGYVSGGLIPSPSSFVNIIDKFPFTTNANATDVGDLSTEQFLAGGQSSTTSGYAGGYSPSLINGIQKFSFATDSNATAIGQLTVRRNAYAGHQY